MSPLARIRQAAACSAFGFFAGLALGAMGLAVGGAGVALMVTSSAVAAAATGAGANMSSPAGQATAATLGAQAAPQPTPGQAAAATSASQTAPQPTSAPATAATSAMQPAPQPTPTQAAATSAAAAPQPVQLAPNVAALIARSALLTIEGTATADALQLSIRRVSDKSLISSDDVTVSVDGKNQSVTHEKGGFYELPINDLRGDSARDVDVTVAHDGIREIVSGKVSVAEASSTSLWRDHKQVAWWILNIVIILIAATAVSRRKG
jgi:hypothetical protein